MSHLIASIVPWQQVNVNKKKTLVLIIFSRNWFLSCWGCHFEHLWLVGAVSLVLCVLKCLKLNKLSLSLKLPRLYSMCSAIGVNTVWPTKVMWVNMHKWVGWLVALALVTCDWLWLRGRGWKWPLGPQGLQQPVNSVWTTTVLWQLIMTHTRSAQ